VVYWSLQNLTDTIGGVVVDSQEPTALVGLIGPRRKALRLSMQKAAELAGVHRLTWRTWEHGDARPQEFNLAGIDKALQLQPGTAAAAMAGRPFMVPQPVPPGPARRTKAEGIIVNASRKEIMRLADAYAEALGDQAAEAFLLRATEIRRDAAVDEGDGGASELG
jgi:transcriptional regulator with XRE-family HTH domain